MKLLVLLFLLAAPIGVQAQLTFVTNNGAITITGYDGNPTILDIPGTTNGFLVTSIATNAFFQQSNMTSVTIPDSVTNIGDSAFQQCYAMTNIIFGTGLTTIGNWAFGYCRGLTTIAIPDDVTTIGSSAFYFCRSLTNFSFGNAATSIGGDDVRSLLWPDQHHGSK